MTAIEPPVGPRLSADRVRHLDAAALGVASHKVDEGVAPTPAEPIDDVGVDADDPFLRTTLELLERYGGVIFTGPPGTSKSWYARRIALTMTDGDLDLVRFVQFHPSYQYEDFVEGYVPKDDGDGFVLKPKHLLDLCDIAQRHPDKWVVLVIDELSRGEPGRVFGEALTYVERTKRGMKFRLSSGTEVEIPDNLAFLTTMNPLDRGVDEVDAAFERRFAKIAMDPDRHVLEQLLVDAGMPSDLRTRVVSFFDTANRHTEANPYAAVGHTFFLDIANEADLRRLWDHQLRFLFEKAYQLDNEGLATIRRAWDSIFTELPAPAEPLVADEPSTEAE